RCFAPAHRDSLGQDQRETLSLQRRSGTGFAAASEGGGDHRDNRIDAHAPIYGSNAFMQLPKHLPYGNGFVTYSTSMEIRTVPEPLVANQQTDSLTTSKSSRYRPAEGPGKWRSSA